MMMMMIIMDMMMIIVMTMVKTMRMMMSNKTILHLCHPGGSSIFCPLVWGLVTQDRTVPRGATDTSREASGRGNLA